MDAFVGSFSLSAWWQSTEISWPTFVYFMGGAAMSIVLVALAMFMGLILGTIMASFQVYGPRWTSWLVSIYVWFFRGVPILVLMFLFYYGLASSIETVFIKYFGKRIVIPPFLVAVTVLGLASSAYQSQIFRGAMQSISSGQFKAATALGMSRFKAVTTIVLPQAWRISIPGWSNEYSILLKDSAIAFVLGVGEIMARFKQVSSTNHKPLLMYALAGLIYFILTTVGVKLLNRLYERTRVPGLAEVDSGI